MTRRRLTRCRSNEHIKSGHISTQMFDAMGKLPAISFREQQQVISRITTNLVQLPRQFPWFVWWPPMAAGSNKLKNIPLSLSLSLPVGCEVMKLLSRLEPPHHFWKYFPCKNC